MIFHYIPPTPLKGGITDWYQVKGRTITLEYSGYLHDSSTSYNSPLEGG